MLSYNTLYNVSITQPGICGQPNQTVFIELSYSKLKYLPIGGNMLVDREAYNYNFKGLFNQYSMKSILL